MRTYRIVYSTMKENETIEAEGFEDAGLDDRWIDFVDEDGTKLLRIRSGSVERIELARDG